MQGSYLGEVYKPYLELKPGTNIVRLRVDLDLRDLPCALVEAWSEKGVATIEASGWAVFTVYAFGLLPVRDVTVSFRADVYNVSMPAKAKPVVDNMAALYEIKERLARALVKVFERVVAGEVGQPGPKGEREWFNVTLPERWG